MNYSQRMEGIISAQARHTGLIRRTRTRKKAVSLLTGGVQIRSSPVIHHGSRS